MQRPNTGSGRRRKRRSATSIAAGAALRRPTVADVEKGRAPAPKARKGDVRPPVRVTAGPDMSRTPEATAIEHHARPPRLRAKDVDRLRRVRSRWVEDAWGPVRFVLDTTRVQLVPDQVDALVELGHLLRGERPGKIGLSVVSGHGCGKTTLDALAGLYVLDAFDNSLVSVTSPKQQQLFDNLWAEAERIINGSDFLQLLNEWTKTRIGVRGENEKWQMTARVAKKGENIAGAHAATKLVIVDEASGVEQEVFEPLIGGMSGARNLIMLTGNGTRTTGEFYNSHRGKDARQWVSLTFNARKSPLVSAEHIARMERKYGKNSPIVRVRVDGGFPEQGERALFSVHAIEEARKRALVDGFGSDKISLGVDVALFGKDHSACVARQGPNMLVARRWHGYDSLEGAVCVLSIVRDLGPERIERINVDANGWGRGLYDILIHVQDGDTKLDAFPDGKAMLEQVELNGVMVTNSACRSDEYFSLRDELWYDLAARYGEGGIAYSPEIDEENIETLESELQVIEGDFHRGTLKHKVASKEQMAKSLDGSPDIADAACLAFWAGVLVGAY